MKRRCYVEISAEAVAQILHLRDCYSVIGSDWNHRNETVRIFIEGDGLPECRPGQEIERRGLAQLTHFPDV